MNVKKMNHILKKRKISEDIKAYSFLYDPQIIQLLLDNIDYSMCIENIENNIKEELQMLYEIAQNTKDLNEIKTLYKLKYEAINLRKISKKTQNILFFSEYAKYMLKTLTFKQTYATLLSQPHIIGRTFSLEEIADILGISQIQVCQYIKDGLEILYSNFDNQVKKSLTK